MRLVITNPTGAWDNHNKSNRKSRSRALAFIFSFLNTGPFFGFTRNFLNASRTQESNVCILREASIIPTSAYFFR